MSSYRIEKLRSQRDFRRVYETGRSWVMPGAVLYVRPTASRVAKVGFVAGRRLGPAVQRNRAKRLLRGAFRAALGDCRPAGGADLILVARRRLLELRWAEVVETVEHLLTRAQVIERGHQV
ncbi:MAG: ribonuclease P protein component [Bacillota bacterium]